VEWQVGFYLAALSLVYALPLAVQAAIERGERNWRDLFGRPNRLLFAAEVAVAVSLLAGIIIGRSVVSSDFIYFQF
jgi:hypothetical protein